MTLQCILMLPSVVVQFPGLLSAPPSQMSGDPRTEHKGGQFGPEKQADRPYGRHQGWTKGRQLASPVFNISQLSISVQTLEQPSLATCVKLCRFLQLNSLLQFGFSRVTQTVYMKLR